MRSRALVLAAAIVVAPAVARAEGASETARKELEQGYALRKDGKYAEALVHLRESARLEPSLKALINIADCEEHLGKLVDARAHWMEALARAKTEGQSEIASEASTRIQALTERIPVLKLTAPPGTKLAVDGTNVDGGKPVPLDPGKHTVTADGSQRTEITLAEGEHRELEIKPVAAQVDTEPKGPVPQASSGPWRTIGFVGIGVGVVGLGVGSYFGLRAASKQSDANCPHNECGPDGNPELHREAVRAGNTSTVFIIAGSVIAAGGIGLVLFAPSDTKTTVSLAPNGLVLRSAW